MTSLHGDSATGVLSVVATPIGNLEDITLRALRVLREAQIIYCEDTRVTKKLLDRYEIKTPLRRLDAHVEAQKASEVVDRLVAGEHVAYVTDAGTPTISDPGYRLVAVVRDALGDGAHIEAIPGPSALVAALSVAGVPSDAFLFLGFLPHKKGRSTLLKRISETEETVVLYESSHRFIKLLGELATHVGERPLMVAREITKKFEEVRTGSARDIADFFAKHPQQVRGEFVVIVAAR